MPVDFEGSNIIMHKPESMTDEECGSMPAYVELDILYRPIKYLVAWQPNREDLIELNKGKPVFISMSTGALPPHQLFTIDDEGNIN